MKTALRAIGLSLCAAAMSLGLCASVAGALVVNPAQPITDRVSVQVIRVADNAGASAAPLFGTPAQQAAVLSFVDTIWAQAGIDVEFTFRALTYNSTFALTGTPGNNNPRPTGDLDTIIAQAGAAGVLDPNPNTLNLFMTRIVPGFSQTSDNTANGLSIQGGNGITYWGGPNLPGFGGGQEVLASVLSHEIGHNLGLDHILESQNLMQASGSANPGQRLNATQVQAALASPFSITTVPEPTTVGLLALAATALLRRRLRPYLGL